MKSFRFSRKAILLTRLAIVFLLASAGMALASSGGGGEVAPKVWEATDTYRVMNFAVLAAILIFLLRKPLRQALAGRIQGIKEELEELEAKKAEAEKALADYNEKFAKLDQEAETIVQEYIRQGEDAKKRILEEAESAAGKLEEQARRHIEYEFKQARENLKAEAIEQALAKAEEIIRGRITDQDQEKLVEEYLEKVVA
jgi:F-type H+-transporting ATPase subunit b